MNKVPPNTLQLTYQDNISTARERSNPSESQRNNSIMGASSTGSSLFSSNLSSLNDEKVTRFATNDVSTVHSFLQQQQNNTTIVEQHGLPNDNVKTRKRGIPLDSNGIDTDFGGRKKPCYVNVSTLNTDPTTGIFLDGSRKTAHQDFAHEFVDSDTSLSSCEEDVDCVGEVTGMHETIDRNTHILPKIEYSSATIHEPYSNTTETDLEKSTGMNMPQNLLAKSHGIKEELTQTTRPNVQYLQKGNANMPIPNHTPSQCISDQSDIVASSNVSPSTSRNIDDCAATITLGQTPINPVVAQVVSFSNAVSPPIAIVSKKGRGSSSEQSSSDTAIGRWTRQEHEAFLVGLEEYGREWKKVSYKIPTRTSAQIRSHAQKYFAKITRDEQQHAAALAASSQFTGLSPIPGDDTGMDHIGGQSSDCPSDNLSASMLERFNEILKDPETVQRQVEETLNRLRNRYSELQRTIEQKQRRALEQRGGSSNQNTTATTTNTINHISYPPAPVDYTGNGHEKISTTHLSSNNHRSSPTSSLPMTVPLELEQQQQNIIETTKEHRVVESEADVRRYINSSEGSLARRELIALHVLGDTLHRGASQENTLRGSMGCGALPTCNTTSQITVTGSRTSLEPNESHSSGPDVHEKNRNSNDQSS